MSNPQFDMAMLAMKSAAQMGAISRFCVRILAVNRLEGLVQAIDDLLVELDIVGGYHVVCMEEKRSRCAGDREVARQSLQQTRKAQGNLKKITRMENVLVITLSRFTIAIAISKKSSQEVDLLVDNMAIFSDIVENWILHAEYIAGQRIVSDRQKTNMIQNLDKFRECLECSSFHMQECNEQLSMDVMSRLAMMLPVLGLEADQEARILDLLDKCTSELGQFVDNQVEFNSELTALLTRASRQLRPDSDYMI